MTECHLLPGHRADDERFDTMPHTARDRAIRTSDTEREQIIALLRDHAAQGRLTMEEFEERMTAAYTAKTRDDLATLVADLPEGLRTWRAATRAPERARRAARYHKALRAEWAGLAFVGALNIAIWLLVSLAAGTIVYFWPVWIIGPWGAVLLARTAFGPRSGYPHRRRY